MPYYYSGGCKNCPILNISKICILHIYHNFYNYELYVLRLENHTQDIALYKICCTYNFRLSDGHPQVGIDKIKDVPEVELINDTIVSKLSFSPLMIGLKI